MRNLLHNFLPVVVSLCVFLIFFLPLHFLWFFAFWFPKPKGFFRFLLVGDRYWAALYDSNPPSGVILIQGIQKGTVPFGRYKKFCLEKVNKYPELKCCIGTFLGYPCYMKEENFLLDEHIILEETDSTGSLCEFRERVITTPFRNGKSPWTFHVVYANEKQGPVTHFFLGIHHVLGDGNSILNLIMDEKIAKPFYSIEGWNKFLVIIKSFLTSFPPFAKFPIWSKNFDSKKGVFVVEGSPALDVKLLKRVKQARGVKFVVISLTAFTYAIRGHFLKRGIPLPDTVACVLPIPPPERIKSEMTNSLSQIVVSLPLKLWDRQSLLSNLNEQVLELSRNAVTGHYKYKFTNGVLPHFFLKNIGHAPLFCVTSDFPGPSTQQNVGGKTCMDLKFFLYGSSSKLGILFGSLSYNGKWKPTLTVSKDLCQTRSDAQDIVDSVVDYIRTLDSE